MNLLLLIFYGTVFVIMGGIATLWIVRMSRAAFKAESPEEEETD